MKKVNRITSNEDFAKIVHSIKPIRSECFLVYGKINNLGFGRVGLSVSKKLGKAIVRNKIKRQVRAICDELIDYSNFTYDIVIIVRAPFLNHEFANLKTKLSDVLESIGKNK